MPGTQNALNKCWWYVDGDSNGGDDDTRVCTYRKAFSLKEMFLETGKHLEMLFNILR